MIPTFIISLREFLEVFLIIGVFLGISKKLDIRREKEIILASFVGVCIALLIPVFIFFYGDRARLIFSRQHAELLESYLMIFSGFFIAYVVFSLHRSFVHHRSKSLIYAHRKLQQRIFDISLFFTIIFFIVREGFEVALFTATTSLFSRFSGNMTGLLLGFVTSSFFGLLTFFGFMKFSIAKVFKITEYLIILLGAAFVKNGISELITQYFKINLSAIISIRIPFVPASSSYAGHLLNSFFGIEQTMSAATISIMLLYIFIAYMLFIRKKTL